MDAEKKLYIYVTSYVGNLGTKVLIDKKKDDLLLHFSKEYLEKVSYDLNEINLSDDKSLLDCIIDKENIGVGGVLTALWKISDRNKVGLRYNLSGIPIQQGTIEIANYFDINPYRLLTENSSIYFTTRKVDGLYLIGESCYGKKRVRIDSESEAFLTKDYKDEINKILPKYIKGKSENNKVI